jgi:hypothetical protein
MMMMMLS